MEEKWIVCCNAAFGTLTVILLRMILDMPLTEVENEFYGANEGGPKEECIKRLMQQQVKDGAHVCHEIDCLL